MRRMLCASAVLAPVITLAWTINEASRFIGSSPQSAVSVGGAGGVGLTEDDVNYGRTRALPEGGPINAVFDGPQDVTMPLWEFRTQMPELSESLATKQRGLRSGAIIQ